MGPEGLSSGNCTDLRGCGSPSLTVIPGWTGIPEIFQWPTWMDSVQARLDVTVADDCGWSVGLADAKILERLLGRCTWSGPERAESVLTGPRAMLP